MLLPAAPAAAVTVTVMVELAPTPIVPAVRLQVTSAAALVQVQFVPLAETRVRPAGSCSFTCALALAAAPELVTVRVYADVAPTFSAGVGADLVRPSTAAALALLNWQAMESPKAIAGIAKELLATPVGSAVVEPLAVLVQVRLGL